MEMRNPMPLIYKILQPSEWEAMQAQGHLTGAPVDIADGYIHFSTARQVRETAARHFSQARELILLVVDAEALGGSLKWEPSRGGDLFPHLYAILPLAQVRAVHPLCLGGDGVHQFPAELDE